MKEDVCMQYGTPWDTSGNKLERPSEERKSGDTTITGTDWAESSREQILCMPLYYGLRIAAAGNQLLLLRPGIAVKTAKPLAPKQAGAEAGLSKNKSKSGRAHEDSDRRQGPASLCASKELDGHSSLLSTGPTAATRR